MRRIALVDEFRSNARLLAAPLVEAGHQAIIVSAAAPPECMVAYAPELLVVSLYRRPIAFRRPIERFEDEVAGFRALVALDAIDTLRALPRVLVGHAVEAEELPPEVGYDLYLACRMQTALAMPIVARLCLQFLETRDASEPAAQKPLTAPDPGHYMAVIISCGLPSRRSAG